jgi:TIGR03009 family protein
MESTARRIFLASQMGSGGNHGGRLPMPRLRTILISPLVALVATGCAIAFAQEGGGARPAPAKKKAIAPPPAPPNPARLAQLLKDWEKQSSKLKTLEVSIYRIDLSKAWGDEEHYEGHAAFKNPQLAYLDFKMVKLVPNANPNAKKKLVPQVDKKGKRVTTDFETIVCTQNEVWQYRFDLHQIFVFPLDKNERKRALEEGPLPFLFNMKADEVKARYDIVLLEEDAKHCLLQITPKLGEDQKSFSTAWLVLDAEFLLPKRIVLLAPDKKSTKDFNLSNIRANADINPAYFRVGDPGRPWKIERNPGGQPPAQANGVPPRRLLNGPAALRPRAPDADQPR